MKIAIDAEDGHWTALPNRIMEIPMSDGAFRLLTLLCRHANREGSSFPSLQRLATMMGKSKASISSHLSELRDLGLVRTEKRVQGRNCLGLLFVVTFWRQWRQAVEQRRAGKDPVQPAKGPVQQAEHLYKNHIQDNHTAERTMPLTERDSSPQAPSGALVVSVVSDLIKEWNGLARGCPWPSLNAEPSPELLAMTRKRVERARPEIAEREQLSTDTRTRLSDLWKQLGVDFSEEDLTVQTRLVDATSRPSMVVDLLASHLISIWKPHWKKPSSSHHLKSVIDEIVRKLPADQAAHDKALAAFLKRYNAASRQRPSAQLSTDNRCEIAARPKASIVETDMRC